MKTKINTIIAVAVALGVIWIWNAGYFGNYSSSSAQTGATVNNQSGSSDYNNYAPSGNYTQGVPDYVD